MKLFDMIESMFFISLVITFILILLLVYHFRQRVNMIEQKCDTMFELINNIVSEMNQQRALIYACSPTPLATEEVSMHRLMGVQPTGKIPVSIPIEDIDSEEDNEEEEDEEEDSTDREDNDDDENDADESEGEETDSDDEDQANPVDDSSLYTIDDPVKIITLTVDNVPAVEPASEPVENSHPQSATVDGMYSVDLHIEKLPEEPTNHLDDSTVDTTSDKNDHSKIYNKMSLSELKALVIEKGLASDPSKMRKNKLVALLCSKDLD